MDKLIAGLVFIFMMIMYLALTIILVGIPIVLLLENEGLSKKLISKIVE